jgi:hypothetical protein
LNNNFTDPGEVRNAFPNDFPQEKPKSNEWIGRIESATKEEQSWRTRATVYWRRYLNRYSSGASIGRFDWSKARSNIFFSNTEFFRSAVLPEMPEPVIRERYAKQEAEDDQQKQFFSTCADVVERAIEYAVKTIPNKKAVEMFKNDALITGRGVLWVVFNADNDPMSGQISNERIELKHLSYNDFRMAPSRNWEECWWVARRILLDKDGLKKRFGPEIAEKTTFTYPTSEDEQWKGDNAVQYEQRAIIWEIWDKKSKKVFFVSPGNPDILEENPAPYNLQGFFPTPEPLRLIVDPNTMIPNPEFDIYEKEAQDLSVAAERRSLILQSIRARCFVPSAYVDDVDKMNEASDAAYVPLTTNDGVIQNDGGINSVFLYEPIEQRANVLDKLASEMEALTSTIFDITGRSDAMNDAGTQPGAGGEAETATRTIMKGKFGSLRLQKKQELFNDYINEIYKICSELICEMYTQQTLMDITSVSLPTQEEKDQDAQAKQQKEQEKQQYEQEKQQYDQYMQQMQQQQPQQDPNQEQDPNQQPPQDPNAPQEPQPPEEEPVDIRHESYIKKPTWDEVKNYLKDTRLQAYLLEVETEMNVWEADSQTQQARVSLFDTFIEKIEKIMPITQEHPEFSDVLMSLLSFVLDSFKMPASQRNELDDSMQAVQDALKQSAEASKQNPPPPGPEEITAKAEETKAQAEMTNAQTKQQESQMDGQIKQQEVQAKQQEIQGKTQIEQMKYQIDLREIARKEMETQSNAEIAKMKLQLEQAKLQAISEKEQTRSQTSMHEVGEKLNVSREKIQSEMQREQLKMAAKIKMENEKLRHKAEIEKSKLIEKAASADQEYELQQKEADEDLTLE